MMESLNLSDAVKDLKEVDDLQQLAVVESLTHDAVFGEITEHGPNYRNVGVKYGSTSSFACC